MSNRVSRTISDDILNRIIQIESAGKPLAKAATSSATGLFQQIDATWLSLVSMHRPEWAKGRTRAQILALRKVATLNIELGARLTEDNQRMIGMDCTPGDLYLAHFLGPADAKDLFRAHPDTPVSALVSQAVIKANKSIMQGRNAGQVRAWAARKMAQPAKQDWIGKFYTGDGPDVIPLPKPRPVEKPVAAPKTATVPVLDPSDAENGVAVDVPLPPEKPVASPDAALPVPAKPEKEGFGAWIKRKWKAVTGWGSGLSFGSGLMYLTDWKVVATLMVGGMMIVLIVYFIYTREQRS